MGQGTAARGEGSLTTLNTDAHTFGPLAGLKVVEMSAIGPVPFAAGFFADMGADVIRVESPTEGFMDSTEKNPIHLRGRSSIRLDLRDESNLATARELIRRADVVLEGFRPGTMERLGLDPDELLLANAGLIVGRMTGWGQTGPMAKQAGHDMNYIAMAGPLRHVARQGEAPVPPINLIGDFGGGAMFLIAGVLAALYERERSGKGQIIDAAMVDGSAYLMMLVYSLRASGMWREEPGTNLLDTGAPFYDVYETSDGEYLSVGCLEPKFYSEFIDGLGLDPQELPAQQDVAAWPELRRRFAETISTKTRDEWDEVFVGRDACVMGIRSLLEAAEAPHMRERGVFLGRDAADHSQSTATERGTSDQPAGKRVLDEASTATGAPAGGAAGQDTPAPATFEDELPLQPAPAPRFSRTPGRAVQRSQREHGEAALRRWGIEPTA